MIYQNCFGPLGYWAILRATVQMRSTALAEQWGGEQADKAAMTPSIFILPAFGSELTLNFLLGIVTCVTKFNIVLLYEVRIFILFLNA